MYFLNIKENIIFFYYKLKFFSSINYISSFFKEENNLITKKDLLMMIYYLKLNLSTTEIIFMLNSYKNPINFDSNSFDEIHKINQYLYNDNHESTIDSILKK